MQPSNYENFRLFLERLSSVCNFAPMVLCKVNANLSTQRLLIYILSALIDALIIANTWCMEDFRLLILSRSSQ